MTWFVAHCLARSEAIADHHLRQAGYGTLYLHYAATIRHARRTFHVLRPYFPRYVFLETASHGPAEGLYGASKAMGVSQIVGCAGEPLEVPVRVMDELRRRAGPTGLIAAETPEQAHLHRPGSEICITGGPFEHFLAMVERDNGKEVRAWVDVFGRSNMVTLPSSLAEATGRKCPALAG